MPQFTCNFTLNEVKTSSVEVGIDEGCLVRDAVSKAVKEGLVQLGGAVETAIVEMKRGGSAVAQKDVVSAGDIIDVAVQRSVLNNVKLPREVVMQMYARENTLRTCKETQEAYSRHEMPFNSDVTHNLQSKLLWEYDLPPTPDALRLWHTQRHHHRDDPEVRSIPLYIKYDVSREGDLRVGDESVNVRLVRPCGAEAMLSDFVTSRPLIVIAGSYS